MEHPVCQQGEIVVYSKSVTQSSSGKVVFVFLCELKNTMFFQNRTSHHKYLDHGAVIGLPPLGELSNQGVNELYPAGWKGERTWLLIPESK